MGRPSTPELESEIRQSAAGDERITLSLEHVDDDDLAREVKRSTLVVLPHHNMHNSSSLLLALSLDRPALVPRTEVTEAVADEVGEGWVYLYDSEITPEAIESSVTASHSAPQESPPGPFRPKLGQGRRCTRRRLQTRSGKGALLSRVTRHTVCLTVRRASC
jgi:beta-1,4-mannosyltransferase